MQTVFMGYGDGLVHSSVNGATRKHERVIDGVPVTTVAAEPVLLARSSSSRSSVTSTGRGTGERASRRSSMTAAGREVSGGSRLSAAGRGPSTS